MQPRNASSSKPKIYFAGSIRGGRDKAADYHKIASFLKQYSIILDEHVANPNLTPADEPADTREIYQRDIDWIKECDILFAEVSNPSLGVGYELGYAEALHKKIICMYEDSVNLSAMVSGNPNFILVPYASIEELLDKITVYLKL